MVSEIDERIDELRETGRELPDDLRDRLVEDGSEELVDALIEVLEDASLAHEHPQKAGPPVHAAEVLGQLGAEAAVDPLIEVVVAEGRTTELGETAAAAVQSMESGEVRGELVRRYRDAESERVRSRIAECLVGFVEHDESVDEIFVDQLERASGRDQSEALQELRDKADASVIPAIREWLAGADLDPTEIPDRNVIQIAAETIEALGGELNEEERELLDAATISRGK
ncbi:MAG: hypothetical protein ABEL76_16785 [Bradymonadaceae bacterium]